MDSAWSMNSKNSFVRGFYFSRVVWGGLKPNIVLCCGFHCYNISPLQSKNISKVMIKNMSFSRCFSLYEYNISFWVLKSYTVTAWILWIREQTMESSRLEKDLKIIMSSVNILLSSPTSINPALKHPVYTPFISFSRNGNSTTSQRNPFQCLTILLVKNFLPNM